MNHKFFHNFIFCGQVGWCLECFWTGLSSLINGDLKLQSKTSLWMFPIYGLASFIHPISKKMKNQNVFIRGGVYAFFILLIEFITGSLLKSFKACPWDYSNSRFHIDGIIRLDYIPVWFLVGLFFEKLLKR